MAWHGTASATWSCSHGCMHTRRHRSSRVSRDNTRCKSAGIAQAVLPAVFLGNGSSSSVDGGTACLSTATYSTALTTDPAGRKVLSARSRNTGCSDVGPALVAHQHALRAGITCWLRCLPAASRHHHRPAAVVTHAVHVKVCLTMLLEWLACLFFCDDCRECLLDR